MPAAPAAAHIGHQIEHSSAFMGFLVGTTVSLALDAALAAAAITDGAALAVMAMAGGAMAARGGRRRGPRPDAAGPGGPVLTGSSDVYLGPARIPAARAVLDTVTSARRGIGRIACGSDSVFINQYPAARAGDRSGCGDTLASDLS
ncbi:MAG TPA: PAAR domain-containing protein, partial [Paracoccus sp. (in: a-proteobacteria)]|nr:PAAR domain-containing protein [Paracoccus sp. (in: a-proteobacteria)]